MAAAGNGGNTRMAYPASYEHVVSVAAIDADAKVASFSQQNDQVELAAPGVGMRSTIPGGYATSSGTSMATPHVTGVAALVWSSKPNATNTQVRMALRKTAFDLWPAGRDDATGYGLVQGREAVQALLGSRAGSSGSSVDCQAVCGRTAP